ncbi:MAG: sulfotransferase domain-containing protein, partial [Gemmatimonadales bacterium]|nr:sulfotransferase domain-containing protein [Gemmatimonadales bacterium]
VLRWEDEKTQGLGYYGLAAAQRERFKRTLRRHAVLLSPILNVLGRFSTGALAKATFRVREVSGPRGTCSPESFERGFAYQARPEDVFVVTQMKCGTTWMQHLVYEIVRRGKGDLVETGTALYAVSPWLEASKSVSMDDAPLIGAERPSRVIKTHLPSQLCPDAPEAKYVYVARHPVSCFASCADFLHANMGRFAPGLDEIEQWFCSDELMWWGSWPAHVEGWWKRSGQDKNVLFVHFEDMKRDLAAIIRQVVSFLGMAPLTAEELESVVRKCSFHYMQQHGDAFEMGPPHILATEAKLFVKGTADRHRDVPETVRNRVLDWCSKEMQQRALPLEWLELDRAVPEGPGERARE